MLGAIEAGDWRVEFFWRVDRVAHRISRREGATWFLVAESIEGGPDDAWPPSPPFQQVHFERRVDDSTVALLVGMAGGSHWSASVEVDAEGSLHWDIACRLAGIPERLGTSYLSEATAKVADEPLMIAIGDARVILIARDGNDQVAVSNFEGRALDWRIPVSPTSRAQTIRWQYSFRAER